MTASLFVVDAERAARAQVGDTLELAGPEGRHAVAAMRTQVGEHVDLSDTRGTLLHATVTSVTGREAMGLHVDGVEHVPAPQPRIVVVQALPKGDRGEAAVETLTEVGVDVVVPWAAQRCVVRWAGERAERGRSKWAGAAHAAGKQSRRAWFPEVRGLAGTADVVALVRAASRAVVLHEESTTPLREVSWPREGDVVLIVGPEGGVAPEEIEAFTAAGAVLGLMGPTVMRASTAGTVAAAVVLSATQRWA